MPLIVILQLHSNLKKSIVGKKMQLELYTTKKVWNSTGITEINKDFKCIWN